MNTISVIILTYNEEIHIKRCINSVQPLNSEIFVVDSYSTDQTVIIAQSLGARVSQHKWKNYGNQFQWGLDNLPIHSEWIMRIDADEYIEPDLQDEILKIISSVSKETVGVYINLKVFFHGKWIRHGGFYPLTLLRIWRNGIGRVEQRWMDEHIVLPPGAITVTARGNFVDDNRKGITFWVNKHNNYATRDAIDLLNIRYHFISQDNGLILSDDKQARNKRFLKEKVYSRLPIGFRAIIYFFYRYVIKLGFLDGSNGFIYHFMQGLWYRMLVDIKIKEIETKIMGDITKLPDVILRDHGIDVS